MDVVVVDVLGGLPGGQRAFAHGHGERRAAVAQEEAGGGGGGAAVGRAGARGVADGHAGRLAAGGLEDAGEVLVQDGLRVLLTGARGHQGEGVGVGRVVGGAARHLTLVPLFLLQTHTHRNVKFHYYQKGQS